MTKEMITTLLIARHGNTFAPGDVVTRVGKTDLPLVESGYHQGRMLGAYLKQHHLVPDVLFTSHLQRTQQTAAAAQEAMNSRISPLALDIFNEIDYGPDENQPEEIVRARLGENALHAWDEHAIVPNGWHVEPNEIIEAWRRFATEITEKYQGKTVLVVTSNGIARFAPYLTGNIDAFKKQYGLKIATGALCIFTHSPQDSFWSCDTWNIRPDKMAAMASPANG